MYRWYRDRRIPRRDCTILPKSFISFHSNTSPKEHGQNSDGGGLNHTISESTVYVPVGIPSILSLSCPSPCCFFPQSVLSPLMFLFPSVSYGAAPPREALDLIVMRIARSRTESMEIMLRPVVQRAENQGIPAPRGGRGRPCWCLGKQST
jgi:hypothetical protein